MSLTLLNLRADLAQNQITDHLRAFDEELTHEGIILGSVPGLANRDSIDAPTPARMAAPEASSYTQTEQKLRDRMRSLHSQRLGMEKERVAKIQKNATKASGEIQSYFEHVQKELARRVKSRALEVHHTYGNTMLQPPSTTVLDPEKVSWESLNQQVEIKILSIRGVRNKVPAGRYITLVSKLTQLGGWNMPWSKHTARSRYPPLCHLHDGEAIPFATRSTCEICNGKVGSTVPIEHSGTQGAHSMQFDSTLHTFMPPQTSITPYQVLLFEVIQIPEATGSKSKRPLTVAWGAFPTVNSNFDIIRGRFHVALMRGAVRDDFRHYSTMQRYIQENVENWFANLYFEVFPKDREFFGRKEFDLQLKAYNKLLRLEGQDETQWMDSAQRSGRQQLVDNIDKKDGKASKASKWQTVRKNFVLGTTKGEEKKEISWSDYSGNVNGIGANAVQTSWYVQLQYCWRAARDELSLRNPLTTKFWFGIFIFLGIQYAQLFLHGVGLYTALRILGVPIIDANMELYGFIVRYRIFFTTAFEEMFIVIFAQLFNLSVTAVLVSLSLMFRITTGSIPEQFSKFVFTSGIAMLMVPWIQLALSAGLGEDLDDVTRLRRFCDFHKYTDVLAVGLFLVVYLNLSVALCALEYIYTMRIHLNGILQDCYWRINVAREEDGSLFAPGDFEMSTAELTWIVEKAEGWRGANGERRKVIVEQLVTTDNADASYSKKELRIGIYELDVGLSEAQNMRWLKEKSSKLHREFFILENGSVIESLHDGVSSLSAGWVLAEWNKKMNNVFGLV